MKTTTLFSVLAAFFVMMTTMASAQNQQAETILKPSLQFSDVKQVALFLGGVEIRGNEVDAYLDVKQTLAKAAEAAGKAGKKDDENITVEMRVSTAQNFLLLMQRATLKAVEAEKFKAIVSAVEESAKVLQQQK